MDKEITRDDIADLFLQAERIIAPHNNGTSTITISAGGFGVWAAVTACAMALTATVVGGIFVAMGFADQNRQIQELRQVNETQQAYINAAFAEKEPK